MTSRAKIRNWITKHWSIIQHRPENGELAVQEIEPILKEMRGNNKRVSKAVSKMVNDVATAQRMMADGTIHNDNSV